jgi:hypothetical protein
MKNTALNNPKNNYNSSADTFTEVGLVLVFILIIVFSATVLL